jgi:hypothetical protein
LTLNRDIQKRNYELEQVKYVMQGKKVRENPLLDYLGQQNDENGGNNGAASGAGFGSQQQFQLKAYYGEAARAEDDDDEKDEKRDAPKKVRPMLLISKYRKMCWQST